MIAILPSVVFYKFQITLPLYEDLQYYIHWRQLFHTLQLQTGYYFNCKKNYQFHNSSCTQPFHINDLLSITPLYKYQLSLSGIFSIYHTLGNQFLSLLMYQDALHCYQIQSSFYQIIQSNLQSCCYNYKLQYICSQILYLIIFCYYNLKKYSIASSLLKTFLEDTSTNHVHTSSTTLSSSTSTRPHISLFYNPFEIYYLILLMCIEFKIGNIPLALSYYDQLHEKIQYYYGSSHPLHHQLDLILSDLYYNYKMYSYAKIILLSLLMKIETIYGNNHLLYSTICYKLGVIDLYLQQYSLSKQYFNESITIYNNYISGGSGVGGSGHGSSSGGVFHYELALCYHGMSYIYNSFELLSNAIQYSLKSLSLTIKEDSYITIDTMNTILYLGELYEKNNLSNEAIQLYGDGWNIVWEYPYDYDLSNILLILIAKIIKCYLNLQKLSIKMLFDSIASEVYDVKQREWDISCHYIIQQIIEKTPLIYITELVDELIKYSNPGK